MDANTVYHETFKKLMTYNLEALKEIAYYYFNVNIETDSREEIAAECARIETENFVH